MGKPRVTYVFHRPPNQHDDLDTLLVYFYLSRFFSALIDFNKSDLTTDTFLLVLGPRY